MTENIAVSEHEAIEKEALSIEKWELAKEIFSGVTGAASGGLVSSFVRGVMTKPQTKLKGLMFELGAWGLGIAAGYGTQKGVYKELSDFDPLVGILSEYAITKKEN